MNHLAALILVLTPGILQEDAKSLIEEWRKSAKFSRDRASESFLARWKTWSDGDLKLLESAGQDPDPEVAARSREACVRIRIRKAAGDKVVSTVQDFDGPLYSGPPEHRMMALRKIRDIGQTGRLDADDITRLCEFAVTQNWDFGPPALFEFITFNGAMGPFAPLLKILISPKYSQSLTLLASRLLSFAPADRA